LDLGARPEFNGFTSKDRELFWSTRVLEYWSVGKSESQEFQLGLVLSLLHYSSRLQQEGKTIEVPPGVSP